MSRVSDESQAFLINSKYILKFLFFNTSSISPILCLAIQHVKLATLQMVLPCPSLPSKRWLQSRLIVREAK